MPRPYTQSRSCGNFDEENYIIPIIGDADGLLTVTERSYTYLLRNANPDLCPSKFPRSTVDKVFHFMIRRLRRDRNTNTKQVKDYGVQKYLALLTDVEKKWKSCASWSSSLIFELPFQFPLNYPDIAPREKGANWSFHYISADGQRTCYVLPVLRFIHASVQGREWAARFSRANPGLNGTVPPELMKVAFENYISRIVPKPGSIMRSQFFEQFGQQLGKQCAPFPKANPEPKKNTMNLPSPPEKVPGAGNKPDNRSDDESDDESENKSEDESDDKSDDESDGESESRPDSGKEDEPSPAEDESQLKLEEDSDSEEEAPETASEASDQACCNVGMEITGVSDNFNQVPQISDQSNKAEVKITVALRSTSENKAVKRTRSPSAEAVSVKDQSLVADENKTRPEGSPKHKRLKIGDNLDSDNNKEASAKPLLQSNHREDCIPEPETGAKLGFERVSSLDSKIEDSSPSETRTGLEARADKNPPLSNLSIPSSHIGEDICLAESPAHTLQSASAPISVIKNNSASSNSELQVHPDNNTIKIQDGHLSQPMTEGLDLPVLASHDSTSPRPHPTEICIIPDMLTGLERYLDGLDAI